MVRTKLNNYKCLQGPKCYIPLEMACLFVAYCMISVIGNYRSFDRFVFPHPTPTSARNCRFGHIYWRNPSRKLLFFTLCSLKVNFKNILFINDGKKLWEFSYLSSSSFPRRFQRIPSNVIIRHFSYKSIGGRLTIYFKISRLMTSTMQ